MSANLYKPPDSEVLDLHARRGATHWVAVPIGFIVSGLGVFALEPLLVDFIIQQLIQLPEESRAVPMLSLDLLLNTATLVATLYFVVWWARHPKTRASAIVALLITGVVGLLSMSPSNDAPAWYQWSSYASIAVAWWLAQLLHAKLSRDA